jgi:D-3-phosphoglycerate dehydrogenase / 2-oxoglutarate reductase
MSKKVLIATVKPFSPNARDQVVAILEEAKYEVQLLESYGDKSELLAAVADAHAMIIRSDKITAEVLDAAVELKLVVRAGSGHDNVDGPHAKGKGVLVMNTPGQNSNAVAELVLSMMVYMARGRFNGKPGRELRGKTLGIHAYGYVGKAVTTVAKGFGMKVSAYDPFVEAAAMEADGVSHVATAEDLYKQCDYVSIHMPATPKTINSIGKDLLTLMPEGGTLINTARAEVINDPEIVEVMAARPDFRYITDIQPAPEVQAELTEKYGDRYFSTPKKMGAQTLEANVNAGLAAARQIVDFLDKGVEVNVVNR